MQSFPFLNVEYLFRLLYQWVVGANVGGVVDNVLFWWRLIALIVTPILWVVIGVLVYRIVKLRAAEEEEFTRLHLEGSRPPSVKNEAWARVLAHITTDNPAEWKLAVLEADKMLDALVASLGYQGGDLGERLKQANAGTFQTLQEAWDAHKVRNQIAHEPNFMLTQHQAREAIGRYQHVFEEFKYI